MSAHLSSLYGAQPLVVWVEDEATRVALATAWAGDPVAIHVGGGNDVYMTMKPQPIDVSIWNRHEKVEIPTALVLVPDMSIVCRVLFFNGGKDRRLMIEFLANDELFGRWERLRQDEKPCDVSVDGAALGKTKIASVERGVMRSDGSYALQIEFVKAEPADG